jgi:hypothetical protein
MTQFLTYCTNLCIVPALYGIPVERYVVYIATLSLLFASGLDRVPARCITEPFYVVVV